MGRLNRDVYVAVFLLLFCGIMFWASFDIREPDYGVLAPSVWPRVILAFFAFLSLIYLIQSIRRGADDPDKYADEPKTLGGWVAYWRNPFICFVLFGLYLTVLPWLGMLISGIVFVFALLTALGGFEPRRVALHAAVAVISVGGMWSLFTFGLNVLLPTGELTGI